jgi:hypothetical protein
MRYDHKNAEAALGDHMLDELHSGRRQGFGGGLNKQEENESTPGPAYAGNNVDETKNEHNC